MFPHERSLVKKMEGKPFALLGINTDDNHAQIIKNNADQQITWRSWWDHGRGGPICRKYKVHGFPTILVLDAKGIIRYKDVRGQALEDAVEALLKEKSAIDKNLPNKMDKELAGEDAKGKDTKEATGKTNAEQKSEPKAKSAEEERIEHAATQKLQNAKEMLSEGKKDRARQVLQDLLRKYPDSKAAEEAEELLEKLKT
jgi:TolA-binding protein